MKGRKVCIIARSPPASLSFKGMVAKHTTVKWSIEVNKLANMLTKMPTFLHFEKHTKKLKSKITITE